MSQILVFFGGLLLGAALFDSPAISILPGGAGLVAIVAGFLLMAGVVAGNVPEKEQSMMADDESLENRGL